MATTPEGKVKAEINKLLDANKEFLYSFMPVPGGYGKSTIDYLGCFKGHFFGIEAKRAGKHPTTKQSRVLEEIRKAGGAAFAINDESSLDVFRRWLAWVSS